MDNNNDNISIIGDFIDAQTDYITSKTRYEGLRNDYRVASEHAARLQELHGRHPESKAIAVNLQHSLEWKAAIRAKLENAKVEINYSTAAFNAAISQAQEAGIIRQTGSEWWQVELI